MLTINTKKITEKVLGTNEEASVILSDFYTNSTSKYPIIIEILLAENQTEIIEQAELVKIEETKELTTTGNFSATLDNQDGNLTISDTSFPQMSVSDINQSFFFNINFDQDMVFPQQLLSKEFYE